MKQIMWLLLGILAGFIAAHKISKTEQGRAFFDQIDARTREFTDAVVEGYRDREAELRSLRNK